MFLMTLPHLITKLEAQNLPHSAEQARILHGMLLTEQGCVRVIEAMLEDIVRSAPIEAYMAVEGVREEIKRLKDL